MEKYFYTLNKSAKDISFRQYIHDINRYRFNWHQEVEISLVLSGRVQFCIEGKNYLLEEDDLVLVNSNMGHASMLREVGGIAMVLRFNPVIFRSAYDNYMNVRLRCISSENGDNEDYQKIRYYMARMMRAQIDQAPHSPLIVEGAFQMLTGLLLENFKSEIQCSEGHAKEMSHRSVVQKILHYIEENYHRKITLEEIAEIAQYSRVYVSTFFKENVGIKFYDHLTRIRLRHAIYEVNATDKTLTQISLDNGFPDLKTFSACFRRYFQKTPNQYRQEVRESPVDSNFAEERHFLPLGFGCIEDKLTHYLSVPFAPRQNTICVTNDNRQIENMQSELLSLSGRLRDLSMSLA